MIEFSFTTDPELIKSVICHPKVWPWFSEGQDSEQYEPEVDNDLIKWIAVREDGKSIGVFIYVQRTNVCYEQHTALLPSVWGAKASRLWRELQVWIWENTDWERLEFRIVTTNRAAIAAATRHKLEYVGVSKNSILVNNQLMDHAIFGLSRPEGE